MNSRRDDPFPCQRPLPTLLGYPQPSRSFDNRWRPSFPVRPADRRPEQTGRAESVGTNALSTARSAFGCARGGRECTAVLCEWNTKIPRSRGDYKPHGIYNSAGFIIKHPAAHFCRNRATKTRVNSGLQASSVGEVAVQNQYCTRHGSEQHLPKYFSDRYNGHYLAEARMSNRCRFAYSTVA